LDRSTSVGPKSLPPRGRKREEVAQVAQLRCDEVRRCELLIVGAYEVDVLRRSGPLPDAEIERQGTLENPAVRRCDHESGEKPIEGDTFP
jgi:hypothetical protein